MWKIYYVVVLLTGIFSLWVEIARYRDIFRMSVKMYTPASVSTLTDTRLITSARHIVQPDRTSSASVFRVQHLTVVSARKQWWVIVINWWLKITQRKRIITALNEGSCFVGFEFSQQLLLSYAKSHMLSDSRSAAASSASCKRSRLPSNLANGQELTSYCFTLHTRIANIWLMSNSVAEHKANTFRSEHTK